jgi:hypothetical protein
MLLSDGKCRYGVLDFCVISGWRRPLELILLPDDLTHIVTRTFEPLLGFLCRCKLNMRVVVIRHIDRDLESSVPDLMYAFNNLLDRRAMRSLQRLVAFGSVFNVVYDDIHELFAWTTKHDHDSCSCGVLGPAVLDSCVREIQRLEQRNHVSPSMWLFLQGCEPLETNFHALFLHCQNIALGPACLCACDSLYKAYTETLTLIVAYCSMHN